MVLDELFGNSEGSRIDSELEGFSCGTFADPILRDSSPTRLGLVD